MLPSYNGRRRIKKVNCKNFKYQVITRMSISGDKIFGNEKLTHQMLPKKRRFATDHKQSSLVLYGHGLRVPRPPPIEPDLQVLQETNTSTV